MQCYTCSKWIHLRHSLLSFSRFKSLGSSHSWSSPLCCIPASSGDPTPTNTVFLFGFIQFVYLHCANAVLPPHPCLQTSYPSSAHFLSSPSAPFPLPRVPGCFSIPPAFSSSPDSLMVLQWNAGGLCARSTKLLHFILYHLVDFLCIQESNLNSSFSF